MKTRKEILKIMIDESRESELRSQIMNEYFLMKVVSGQKAYENAAGQAQRNENDAKEMVRFLEGKLNEK